jgi:hypothetical protein
MVTERSAVLFDISTPQQYFVWQSVLTDHSKLSELPCPDSVCRIDPNNGSMSAYMPAWKPPPVQSSAQISAIYSITNTMNAQHNEV